MAEIRVLTWNVAGRVGKLDEQARAVVTLKPDIVALQEVTKSTEPRWRQFFEGSELRYLVSSRALAPDQSVLTGPRKYTQMIASRWPLRAWPEGFFGVPWKERVLSAEIESPAGVLEFHTTHVPPGASNGWTKIDHFRGIAQGLAVTHRGYRILCGDFNSPQRELEDGTIRFWGEIQRKDGSWAILKRRGPEWSAGERSVLSDLRAPFRMRRTA